MGNSDPIFDLHDCFITKFLVYLYRSCGSFFQTFR
nr:MAG TPA: hypothetical protein [Caudoviricetes sp.]